MTIHKMVKLSDDIEISVIAYDGSFRERFFQVDSLENQTLDKSKFQYIWVENFSDPNPKLVEKLENTSLNYKLITLDREKSYHLGKCVNEGVKQSDSEIITVLDADTFLEPNVLEETLNYHNSNPNLVLYIHRYDEPKPPMLRKSNKITLPKLKNRCKLLNNSNFGGFMSISRDNYIKSGGYDESVYWSGFNSAGALDLVTRYENMGLDWEWSDDLKIYHICHENAFGSDRWNGFRVESQWKLIDMRKESEIVKPFVGIKKHMKNLGTSVGYRYREPSEEWEEWLGNFDDKSVGYKPDSEQ